MTNYTKSKETLSLLGHTQVISNKHHHSRLEPEHLLLAMCEDEGLIKVLDDCGADRGKLISFCQARFKRFPVVKSNPREKEVSPALSSIISQANILVDQYKTTEVIPLYLLFALSDVMKNVLPSASGLKKDAIRSYIRTKGPALIRRKPASQYTSNAAATTQTSTILEQCSVDLTEKAQYAKLGPVIGRTDELRRVIQVLCRSNKNNPVLIGKPGVGKNAIVEALAMRMSDGDVPLQLKGKRLLSLDISSIIAGSSLRGQFEEKMKKVLEEIRAADGQIILFVNELSSLVSNSESSTADVSGILKPALARGEVQILASTTPEEFRKTLEKDKALDRMFQSVSVVEPSVEQTMSILRGTKSRYENIHGVKIQDPALMAAISLSRRYIPNKNLPDKAIDLIDEAASRLRIELDSVPSDIDSVQRQLNELHLQEQVLKDQHHHETAAENYRKLVADIEDTKTKLAQLNDRWHRESNLISNIRSLNNTIETTAHEFVEYERAQDFAQALKVKTENEAAKASLELLTKELEAVRKNGRLLREDILPEDIAEVVADITGIPVSNMLQSEKDRLIKMEAEVGKRVIGQKEAMNAIAKAVRRSRAGLNDPNRPVGSFFFLGPTGVGKCLAPETPVLTYDGDIIAAKDVKKGMRLMGPDSLPRNVLSTTVGQGPMYRISPARGDEWSCNDVHILTLVHTETGEIKDVPLNEYLQWSKTQKHLWKQFSVGVNFPERQKLKVDPYFLGVWLGDGTKSLKGVSVSKDDAAIVAIMEKMAHDWDLKLYPDRTKSCTTWHLFTESGTTNPLLNAMREYVQNEQVSKEILTSSRDERLEFLAGCLDSDGHLIHNVYEFSQKNTDYMKAVKFVARSLGFKVVSGKDKVLNGEVYQRCFISGNTHLIPCRIPRKKATKRLHIKDALRTGFKVSEPEQGEYAGFTLDGDGRFLLGDFTVTHNTELAKALASFLFEDETNLIRFDMSEFMEKHTVARLIGAPPGYKGAEEGGQLTEAVKNKPYSVVLFDEVEKGHPDVFNLLLQILDDGRLTDSQGTLVDFKNTVIIMTSNVGSQFLLESTIEHGHVVEEAKESAMEDMKKHFRPEFLGRIDEIVFFHGLTRRDIDTIADIHIKKIESLLAHKKLKLNLSAAAKEYVINLGFQPAYGARPLRRALQRYLQDPLSLEILKDRFVVGDTIYVDMVNDELVFEKSRST